MREILFRGRRIDGGEWLYGHYVHQYGADMIYLPDGVDREYGFDYYHIDKETVGQYTGLMDRNGKKIFEGDIIKRTERGTVFEVGFDYGAFGTVERYPKTLHFTDDVFAFSDDSYGIMPERDYEIIGNIHDNPELLN